MKSVHLRREDLVISPELGRSGQSWQFEERLQASIEEIGLSEPIKVAKTPDGSYLVVDGCLRVKAIDRIVESDPSHFPTIPAYLVDYAKRFEVRFQTDIYQDLLPSQLAVLVEHLHNNEHVRKVDIARYIGVSPPTLRNYTGVARMLGRGVLFSKLVELMDVGVIPASNPYAWLRLTADGVRYVIETSFSDGERAETWIKGRVERVGAVMRCRSQSSTSRQSPRTCLRISTERLPRCAIRSGIWVCAEHPSSKPTRRLLPRRPSTSSTRFPSSHVSPCCDWPLAPWRSTCNERHRRLA